MSTPSLNGHSQSTDRILAQCHAREAAIAKRKKRVMGLLLSEFERDIEPLIRPGNQNAVDKFKVACRTRLNALTVEAINQLRGGAVNELAGDLAESIELDPGG